MGKNNIIKNMVNHKNTHIILIQTFDFFLIINLLRKKAAARKRIAYTAKKPY
jgi:hypothetical protein